MSIIHTGYSNCMYMCRYFIHKNIQKYKINTTCNRMNINFIHTTKNITKNTHHIISIRKLFNKIYDNLLKAENDPINPIHFGQGTLNSYEDTLLLLSVKLQINIEKLINDIEIDQSLEMKNQLIQQIQNIVNIRIKENAPMSYLVGGIYQQGLLFNVDNRVLIPRSYIGEILHDSSRWNGKNTNNLLDGNRIESVLDLCTGSGVLAILASNYFSNVQVIDAADISIDALEVAKTNINKYQKQSIINLFHGNLFDALATKKDSCQYDLIICNPPYVDERGMRSLPREFQHEPASALSGGKDGLELVSKIIKESRKYLKPGGGLLLEIGRCQRQLIKTFPTLAPRWIRTLTSKHEVIFLSKEALEKCFDNLNAK